MSVTDVALPPAKFLRLDLFPALITSESTLPNAQAGNVWDARRLIVTDTHVLVFSDSSQGPVLTFVSGLVDFSGRNTTGWDVVTEDLTFKVRRSNGCGCGSRLRGLYPYPGVPFTAQL